MKTGAVAVATSAAAARQGVETAGRREGAGHAPALCDLSLAEELQLAQPHCPTLSQVAIVQRSVTGRPRGRDGASTCEAVSKRLTLARRRHPACSPSPRAPPANRRRRDALPPGRDGDLPVLAAARALAARRRRRRLLSAARRWASRSDSADCCCSRCPSAPAPCCWRRRRRPRCCSSAIPQYKAPRCCSPRRPPTARSPRPRASAGCRWRSAGRCASACRPASRCLRPRSDAVEGRDRHRRGDRRHRFHRDAAHLHLGQDEQHARAPARWHAGARLPRPASSTPRATRCRAAPWAEARGARPDRLPLSRRSAPGAVRARRLERHRRRLLRRRGRLLPLPGAHRRPDRLRRLQYCRARGRDHRAAGARRSRRVAPSSACRTRSAAQIVKAYVVLRAGHARPTRRRCKTAAGLRQARGRAPYKYPRTIEFVGALPRTATGKLQRFRLKKDDPAGIAPAP